MAGWIEDRQRGVERRVEDLLRLILDTVLPQLRGVQQGLQGVYQQYVPNSSSSNGGYWCAPANSIAAATGVPGVGAPGGPETADVYQMQSGAYVLVATNADIYNGMLSATTAGRTLAVWPNGDGSYSAPGQSCT